MSNSSTSSEVKEIVVHEIVKGPEGGWPILIALFAAFVTFSILCERYFPNKVEQEAQERPNSSDTE